MKEKILLIIIGVLVGAIISTTGFLIFSKSVANKNNNPQMNQNGQMGQPPEIPNENNGQSPQMPNGEQPSTKTEN